MKTLHQKPALQLYTTLLLLFAGVSMPCKAQTNIALGKTVSSSATVAGASASRLTDGSFSTDAVTTGAEAPPGAEWFQVDLGADYLIDSIRLTAADTRSSRRFMVVTWPSAVGASLGNTPTNYIANSSTVSLYNRYIYTDTANVLAANAFGTYAGNPAVPGTAGLSYGPAFPSGSLGFNTGVHKARFVLIMSLQDTAFALSELQVFTTTAPNIRTFSNGNFEAGMTHTGYSMINESSIAGWSTTEAVAMASGKIFAPEKGSYIEIWRSGFQSVTSASGNYHAELNAFSSGMLEQQPICVKAGETFTWSFAHRGRSGVDTMDLRIDDVDVASFRDSNASSGTHAGVVLAAGLGTTTISGSVTHPTNGWTQWTGTWTNSAPTARSITFGFRAVGSAGGDISKGNFIDSVSITTSSAFVTLSNDTGWGAEDIPAANLPRIIVNGRLDTAHTVEIDITGGTAIRGTDYTTTPAAGIITVSIPAGSYNGTYASGISLAPYISIVYDATAEPNETIAMRLQNPSSPALQIVTDTACQPTITRVTYTILDAVPLPTDLVSFDADFVDDCTLRLSWTSGVECQLSHYQLECSRDGRAFLPVMQQKKASGSNAHYEQIVGASGEGLFLYRLKMIDLAGRAQYSEVLPLHSRCDAQGQLLLYPNPSDGLLRLKGLAQEAAIRVTDVSGRQVLQAMLHDGADRLDISSLQPGLYILTVQTAGSLQQYPISRR